MTKRPYAAGARTSTFDRGGALKRLGLNLTVNALCPFLLYRILQSHFAANSIMPLLYATAFPVVGLVFSLVRKRTVDAIAIIVMVGIALHIVVTLVAGRVSIALIVRSFDGALIGLALIISALVHRPIILFVAKQMMAGSGGTGRTFSINNVIENDGAHTFFVITLVWGVCLMAMSGVHVLLALKLPPAEFLLVSPVIGVVTIVALLVRTRRYFGGRMQSLP